MSSLEMQNQRTMGERLNEFFTKLLPSVRAQKKERDLDVKWWIGEKVRPPKDVELYLRLLDVEMVLKHLDEPALAFQQNKPKQDAFYKRAREIVDIWSKPRSGSQDTRVNRRSQLYAKMMTADPRSIYHDTRPQIINAVFDLAEISSFSPIAPASASPPGV